MVDGGKKRGRDGGREDGKLSCVCENSIITELRNLNSVENLIHRFALHKVLLQHLFVLHKLQ